MATKKTYHCPQEGHACQPNRAMSLFAVLKGWAEADKPTCKVSGLPIVGLEVELDFDLGEDDSKFWVRHCFYVHESWKKEGKAIEFYPFLVVLEKEGRGLATWFPFWHVVEGKRPRFGQWAPVMDVAHFQNLLKQAKDKGYDFEVLEEQVKGELDR
jgi:hypothetical protein